MDAVVNTLGRLVLWLFILLGAALALNTFSYFNFDSSYGFLKLKQDAVRTGWYLPFYYCHVLTGGIILLAGFVQFNGNIRNRFRKFHRYVGHLYVGGILFFAAPGGMVMSLFIDRGPWVLASFVIQCSLWIYCTLEAYKLIRRGQVAEHEKWMIRSFALTLAAITLRLYIFASSWSVDLGQPSAYATLAWASWLPNLVVAEWIIRKKITSMVSSYGIKRQEK